MMNNDAMLLENIMLGNVLNQVQLAKQLNTSKQFISQVVNGKRNLSKKMLSTIRELFPSYFANYNLTDDFSYANIKEIRNHYKLSREQFAEILGISTSLLFKVESGERTLTPELKERILLFNSQPTKNINLKPIRCFDALEIKYCPDIQLPADSSLVSKTFDIVTIDKKLLMQTAVKINPNKCKIISLSNDSLAPIFFKYDKCIIDESVNHFVDDQIFAFLVNGQCYLRRINILPSKIKCTSVERGDTFYLESEKECTILGMIVSRIRF